jgi:gluconolactonase
MGNASLERLWTGGRWVEGPVYFRDRGYLLWSDIPNNCIMRWTEDGQVGVYRQPSNHANGHTRDVQGRLVSCEHSGRRISRTELDGSVVTLVDSYGGGRLNSPNDVIVKSDGTVWFSDPSYGILGNYEGRKAPQEQQGCYVYRFDPATGDLSVVADDFVKPNGLAFSSDETVLYVSDTGRSHDPDGPHHIRSFDVIDGRSLSNSRVFAAIDPGLPDGFRVDEDDNVWTSAGDGVQCLTSDGTLIGKIRVPETTSNCVFGGQFQNRLFMTSFTSVYAVYLNARGVQTP